VDPESGVVLGPKQNGELLIRSPLVMKGYKGVSTSGVIDVEGWLHTGNWVFKLVSLSSTKHLSAVLENVPTQVFEKQSRY